MTAPYTCPGCGGSSRAATADLPESVFTLNYVYRTRTEALAAPKAPLRLEECRSCGFVHAPADEPMHSCYDADYENTQEHSATFLQHLHAVRALLGQPTGTGMPCRVLEVGCGKGGFLRLLCQEDGWSGDGYGTSYAGRTAAGVRFHRQYVTPEAVAGERYDPVVCRHVVEHVPEIGAFLAMLAEVTRRTGASRLMIETPDFGWIAGNGAFWDVFHEHRNYFTRETLALLCQKAGLRVAAHPATFQGQYQNLLLKASPEPSPGDSDAVHPGALLASFHNATVGRVAAVAAATREAANQGEWAIWGAGAKGVCLANHLKRAVGLAPVAVFDINPAKQGSFLPGHHPQSSHPPWRRWRWPPSWSWRTPSMPRRSAPSWRPWAPTPTSSSFSAEPTDQGPIPCRNPTSSSPRPTGWRWRGWLPTPPCSSPPRR